MISARFLESSELDRLRPDWEQLYAMQYEQGLTLRVPIDGFELWVGSIEAQLGRFAVVAVAEESGEIAGFVAARFRTALPYLGGQPIGYVSEVFTKATFRNLGVAARLLDMVVDWFRQQGIKRLELHVAVNNADGLRFYERHGWRAELMQLVLGV